VGGSGEWMVGVITVWLKWQVSECQTKGGCGIESGGGAVKVAPVDSADRGGLNVGKIKAWGGVLREIW
jgi:hypothetical protein